MEESPRKRLEHLLDEVHEHQTSHHRHDSASTDSLRDLQRDLVSARTLSHAPQSVLCPFR